MSVAVFICVSVNLICSTNNIFDNGLKVAHGFNSIFKQPLLSINNSNILNKNGNAIPNEGRLKLTADNITNIQSSPNGGFKHDNLGSSQTDIPKFVILSFDDGKKGDYTYAKPILDKYRFKGTFFIVCDFVSQQQNDSMNWQEINALAKDGMDIESHTMTHPHLNLLSQAQLDYEIGGSKKCIDSHGFNTTVFAYPYNDGSNNATVVKTVAKYYEIGRAGSEPLMFLDCQGFQRHHQPDCNTYNSKGKLSYANRYDARSYTVDRMEMKNSFDETKIFSDFIDEVNSQDIYNHKNEKIVAVPLITFHDVGPVSHTDYVTNSFLFDKMMKYLHDNGFRVLNYNQLGYDSTLNEFYLKWKNNYLLN